MLPASPQTTSNVDPPVEKTIASTVLDDVFVSPASFSQRRLWLINQIEGKSHTYNMSMAVTLRGFLNVSALERAFAEIVARHEVLRTNFQMVDSALAQVVTEHVDFYLRIAELPLSEDSAVLPAAIRRTILNETLRPFNLAEDSLFRVSLLRFNGSYHALVVTMHHIVSDGWSMDVLKRELVTLYNAFSAGRLSPLAALPIQYADFAEWQQEMLSGDRLDIHLNYWRSQLADLPSLLSLPTDRPRPSVQTYRGQTEAFRLSPALTQQLKALGQQSSSTLFMTLLSAFSVLLSRYSGSDDIVVGSPIANRQRQELEPLIGCFVNTLVLRSQLTDNLTFTELLTQVRQMTLAAYAHQDLPFEKLVEDLQPVRSLSYSPLFQVMFVLQNAPRTRQQLSGLEMKRIRGKGSVAKFDLTLSMSEAEIALEEPYSSHLTGCLEYNSDLFDSSTIERLAGHFQTLLAGIVANPDQQISELPLLTSQQRHQILMEWNNTQTNYPRNQCIHHLFEAQAQQSPDSIAVISDGQCLTYQHLNERANQLARYLRSIGVKPDTLIGICIERSIGMVVGLLAILKADAAYLPLDTSYPAARLAFMLEDAQATVVLVSSLAETLSKEILLGSNLFDNVHVVEINAKSHEISQLETADLASEATAESLAYVMYTSGSTGKPKGIGICHRGVVRLVRDTNYIHIREEDVFLQLAPISFDAATFELWGALLNGAKLVISRPQTFSSKELSQILQQHQVSILWLTAGLFHLMADENIEAFRPLRYLLAGGEVVSTSPVKKLLQAHPNCQFINGYGPTENTTFSCCYPVSDAAALETAISIPIGRPIANTQAYVLDQSLNPVPVGVPGELYLGGDGLAKGYLNLDESTKESFIEHPFCDRPGARLYKSRDLVRYLPDGNLEFLGRLDNQVKLHGFRIELGEIESVLEQYPAIQKSVATIVEVPSSDKRLVAYVVLVSDDSSSDTSYSDTLCNEKVYDEQALCQQLREKLPDYLIPRKIVVLETLPLTNNGKIDRQALPMPSWSDYGTDVITAPHTLTEELLAQILADVLDLDVKRDLVYGERTPVDIHTSFFEMGGHSLALARLVSQVQQIFRVELPLQSLFQESTIASLARRIETYQEDEAESQRCEKSQAEESPWSFAVPMQIGGSKAPVFLIPGGDSGETELINLSRLVYHLGTERPVYGMRSQILSAQHQSCDSVEAIAANYVKEICRLQPAGPYLLIGECLGGVIAFEIAQQLSAQNKRDCRLILLDTQMPSERSLESIRTQRKLSVRFLDHLNKVLKLKSAHLLPYLADKAKKTIAFLYPNIADPAARKHYAHVKYMEKLYGYKPRCYKGQVTLIVSEGVYQRNATLGWETVVKSRLDIKQVTGDHTSYLGKYVRETAQVLKACLDEL